MPDGSVKYVHGCRPRCQRPGRPAGVHWAVVDCHGDQAAEEKLHKAQTELVHVTRVTTLGELTASIAHEVNQPLAAAVANARGLSALARPRDSRSRRCAPLGRMDHQRQLPGERGGSGVFRALAKKSDIEKVPLDVNDVVREAIVLVKRELSSPTYFLASRVGAFSPHDPW